MLFSSTVFLFIFLPLVLLGYYALPLKQRGKNILLLVASLLFYAWGEPVFVFLMIGSIAVNYSLGLWLSSRKGPGGRKALLILAVILNLGVLYYFKYLNFTIENINALFRLSIPAVDVTMPIGISFFTFQAMSYVIDVYRGRADVQRDPLDLGLYISCFPQLIAGPIVRYNSIAEQIQERHTSPEGFQNGVCRFIRGLGKKVLLANNLALAAEKGFELASSGQISTAMAWVGGLGFTLQLYFDFSGYSDMAIGLGAMFGFHFEENFNYPYISQSLSEFWNRWHISVGRWFRDYVYIPLGGSRVSRPRVILNILIVWLLTGIWHGAAWHYILWGMLFGVTIALEKFTGFPKNSHSRPAKAAYTVFTLLVVIASKVIFGANDIPSALLQLKAMLGFYPGYDPIAAFCWNETWVVMLLGFLFSVPVWPWAEKKLMRSAGGQVLRALVYGAVMVLSVSYLAMGSHNPFIYFNF